MDRVPATDISKAIGALSQRDPVASSDAFAGLIDSSSKGFGWRGVGVWPQTITGEHQILLPPLLTHHAVILVEGAGTVQQDRPAGSHCAEWTPGDCAFLPQGTASAWRIRGPMRLIHIDLGTSFFRDVCLEVCSFDPNLLRLREGFHARDMELLVLANWLLREITDEALDGPIYAEAIGVLVTVHLLRAFAGDVAKLSSQQGALSKPRLRRVLDHIGDNVVAPIKVEELAALCSYSPYHFSRAFKIATGLPPKQYQIRLRIERARALLENTSLPISAIAAEVGYECPSQFARVFRKDRGVSPSELRSRRERSS